MAYLSSRSASPTHGEGRHERRRLVAGRNAALLLAALAAVATPSTADDCDLGGTVMDQGGGPIAGATVTLAGTSRSTVTTDRGLFCLQDLAPGGYRLVVVADGFAIGGAAARVAGDPTGRLEITLLPAFGEELVVTTTRTERRLADLPIHVQTFSREELDRVAARTLAEAVEWTPGLRVESNCQNCNTSQVRMLGLDGAYSQLLIDGQPTVSSLALVYGLEQLPARLIDSIEVVKGGGSALYGAGAIAGVINLIPHDPSSTAFAFESRVWETGRQPGYSINTGLDWASRDGRSAWTVYGQLDRVEAADVDGDGFSEVTRRRLEALGARGARYLLADAARLSVDLNRTYEFRRGGDLLAIDLPPDRARIAEEIVSERLGGSLSWLHTVGSRFDYRLVASLSRTERQSYYGTGFDPDAFGSTDNPLWVVDAQLNHYRESGTFTWGAQYSRDGIDDRQPGYGRLLTADYRNRALFAQHERKVGDRLSLLYGARLDDHSELDRSILSPRAALIWSPRPTVAVRASLATGFRPPVSFDEDLHIALLGGGASRVVRNAPDLREESSLNRSLSIEWRPRVGRRGIGLLEMQLFHTTIDDLFNNSETDDPATEAIEFTKQNLGRAEVRGVELSGALIWSSTWSIEAAYVLQSARFDDPEPDFGSREFFRTPRRYGNARITWRPRIAELFLGLRYTGPMKAPHYAGFIAEDRLESTPPFLTLDLNVAREVPLGGDEGPRLRLSLGAKNLTDEFQQDLDRGPQRDASYVYGPRFPRTLFFSASLEL